ncbi:MAG: BON domain-containing protein [Acidobacteria bacterium]|nr:BON domain-containing protein [Acidobacteriota bacterium]
MFRHKAHIVVVAIVLVAVAAGIGCASKPDDHQIAYKVQTQIRNNSAIDGEVTVDNAGGVITLNGQVGSEAARQLAARDAAGVAGVKVVTNNLTVASPLAEAAPPPPVEEKAVVAPRRTTPRRPVQTARAIPPRSEPVYVAPPPAPEPALHMAVDTLPPPPPPAPTKYTIPAGSVLSVRLVESLDSSNNRVGDTFRATLDAPIRADGEVVIPAGLDVEGRVVEASKAGKYTGHPELTLELSKLFANGEVYSLRTDQYNQSGGGRGKGTAATVGTGAGLGAVIGGIAGGSKGAAIGAMAGAGAGGVARAAQGAPKISFPSETVLTFRLEEPLIVPAYISNARGGERWSDRNYESPRPQLKRRATNFE